MVSLRWVSGRLDMGHYTHAGRGPRKLSAGDLRNARKARSQRDTLAVE